MKSVRVDSLAIRSDGYHAASMVLEIEFTATGLYQYVGVPKYKYDALMDADSKGACLYANIKDQYPTVKP